MSILDQADAVEEMLNDRLPSIAQYIGGGMPTPQAIWRKLQAAEAEVSRKLAVPLSPIEVFSVEQPTSDEIAALDGAPYIVDPGYEMEGGWLGSFQWATIKLLRRPLIEVKSVKFVYPTITMPIYDVPLDWVYPDRKSGIIQFTPKPTSAGVAPSILSANIMSQGSTVPQMVRVHYTAGLTPDHELMPEILDVLFQLATLGFMRFSAQSGSISADGLSQSKSVDVNKFKESIDDQLEGLKERIKGPTFGVL